MKTKREARGDGGGGWRGLDRKGLFEAIEACDAVCPMREADGSLHLVSQELDELDYVPKQGVEQVVRFDEETQLVEWEAFCPRWRVPDAVLALRFASDWMRRHAGDSVYLDAAEERLCWRRVFWCGWVSDDDDVEAFCERHVYGAMSGSVECLLAAQLVLGGF